MESNISKSQTFQGVKHARSEAFLKVRNFMESFDYNV